MNHPSNDLEDNEPRDASIPRVYLKVAEESHICEHCRLDLPKEAVELLGDAEAQIIASLTYCDECGEEFY